jgi:dTDP-glucose 4,6-dehydratase
VLGLAETIRDLTGSASPIEFIPRPVDDPAVRRPDTTLARHRLGWRPAITLEEGLRRTIGWFTTTTTQTVARKGAADLRQGTRQRC